MSSLTEQERIGLEDVFLSISSSQNIFQKCSCWGQNLSFLIKSKYFFSPRPMTKRPQIWFKNRLNKHKITKLITKIQKRRKF